MRYHAETCRQILLQLVALPWLAGASAFGGAAPEALQSWLEPQSWRRDVHGPILSLGDPGRFDDTHIFAPAVIHEKDRYLMWYCGSRGAVNKRVFRLGLATSNNGRDFTRFRETPVFELADGRHSVLTPALLRSADGRVLRENGQLRMWFSSTSFLDKSGLHTLHESTSDDGVRWSPPSVPLIKHVYAPTVIRDGKRYRMWYVDVERQPWIIRHAMSDDGRRWRISPEPCLVIDQPWERSRLFYPTVLKVDGVYLMWYGSYWSARDSTTALGFAVSPDGLQWHKHPGNPVFRPDPERPWESHYVTSQSVMRMDDRSYRMWYASRRKPPFINKYFALNTAVWNCCQTESPPKGALGIAAAMVHKHAFDRPHDVQLQDGLAFVAGKGGSLAIVDVSLPSDPKLVWYRHDAERLDDAETVMPAGDRLFLGTDDFVSLDIRNPQQPVVEARLSTMPRISRINGMARRGDSVIAAGKNGVVAMFDVHQPAAPTVSAAVNVRQQHHIGWPHDVDLYAHYAVVVDPQRFGRLKQPGKLALLQVFDKETGQPLSAERWKLAGLVASAELAGANRVQVSGHHAFVGASSRNRGGRLVVVDLRLPDAPRQVASMPFAPRDGWGPNGLAISGQVVFLAGGQSVEAIDVSRPRQPVKLASQKFVDVLQNAAPRYSGGGDSGHDLVHRDGYLYVTGQNDNCLMILHVDSERIRRLAEYTNPERYNRP